MNVCSNAIAVYEVIEKRVSTVILCVWLRGLFISKMKMNIFDDAHDYNDFVYYEQMKRKKVLV